jgi:hypothetical protein
MSDGGSVPFRLLRQDLLRSARDSYQEFVNLGPGPEGPAKLRSALATA